MAEQPDLKFETVTIGTDVDPDRIRFDDPELAATFRVNPDKRTISGLLVPWGSVAWSRGRKWRFAKGSLYWSDASRIKLNLHHERQQAIAVAIRLQNHAAGLDGTFKVARGEEGDRALSLAEDGVLDGFSIEVDFEDDDGVQIDPSDKSISLVTRARLMGVALTPAPSFDDARVSQVAAHRDTISEGGEPMADKPEESTVKAEAPDPVAMFEGAMNGLADTIAQSHTKLSSELAATLGDSFSAGIKTALEDLMSPQNGGPQPVKAARYAVTRDAPIYTMDGRGHSLVRDAWYASREHDDDAKDRLRRFSLQTNEVQKLVNDQLSYLAADRAQFTTLDTTTGADVIPPGYRPDLFVPQLAQGRPIVNLLSRGTIANATPFVVPIFGSVSTPLTDDHTEGVTPTEGAITLDTKTVTPGAISGKLPLTREIVDSSNPGIDQIALAAMRENYAQQTEAKAYTALNGADGVGGTITTGFVPSGSQAAVTSGQGDELLIGVRGALAKYPFARFGDANGAIMSQEATTAIATAVDTTGRPLVPFVGGSNAFGVGQAVRGNWTVDGLSFFPAWAMTGNAAGDADIIIINSADVWVWESPVLSFRFEEKSGPQIIELALFGYFAVHVLRPVGLSGIRHTAS
jgi:HK97 family phage major capsid protein